MQAMLVAVSAITAGTFATGIDGKIHFRQTVARVAAGKGIHRPFTKEKQGEVGHGREGNPSY